MLKVNGFISGTVTAARKEEKTRGERERERGSFVSDYFPALFAEEDIAHKKGTGRSGDSCFAIKSDLNSKPFPGTQRYPATTPLVPLYFSSAPFRPSFLPRPLSCLSSAPLLAITHKQSVKPYTRLQLLQISELLNEP